MRRPSPPRWVTTLGVVIALLVPTAAAHAHGTHPHPRPTFRPVPTPAPTTDALSPSEALMADAASVAEDRGWSLRQAVVHLSASARFNALTTELDDTFPTSYAGGEFSQRPGIPSVVRFVGTPPADAQRIVDRSLLDVDVRGGAPYTTDQLDERAAEVHDLLVALGYAQVATATTPGGDIEATVQGRFPPFLPAHLRDGVTVTRSDGPIGGTYTTRGGAGLYLGNQFGCTTGFTVEHVESGKRGVATAGHCLVTTYERPRTKGRYGLSFQEEHMGRFGDMEWSTTTRDHPNEFFGGGSRPRTVTKVATKPAAGTEVCLFGRAPVRPRTKKPKSCDQIRYPSLRFTGGSDLGNLVVMEKHTRVPGDSGGPVYSGSTAFGLITGYVEINGKKHDFWTRADLLPDGLKVRVATKP